jgi:hypothetical protein
MRSMQYIWKNSPNGRLPYRLGMLLITISLLASACAAAAPGDLQETPGSQEPAATETPADTATPPAPELFPTVRAPELIPVIPGGPVTPIDPGQPVTGEASAGLMEDIRADLAERSGAAREEMVVIRTRRLPGATGRWAARSRASSTPRRWCRDIGWSCRWERSNTTTGPPNAVISCCVKAAACLSASRRTSDIFGLMQGQYESTLSSAGQKRPAGVIKVSLKFAEPAGRS